LLTGAGELALTIANTRRPARIDDYDGVPGAVAASIREELGIRSSAGSPILVEGRLWGALFVHATHAEPLPADTEVRLRHFTELVATAISNSDARAEVERLANEQAGLRRVATLVAHKSPPAEVFAAVGEEVGWLLRVESTSILRYEDDGTATVVARSRDEGLQVGDSLSLEGESVTARVHRTGRPARFDDYSLASGGLGTQMREAGVRSAVGAPIVVEGRLWGAIVASTRQDEPLPAEVESRIGEFTELLATTISNVQAWSDLAASRARIVAAADEERRRVVRDLHDGAQQRFVHTIIMLKLAQRALARNEDGVPALLSEALDHAERANDELRELAHGILPEALTQGGLHAGVAELASRTPVPVAIDVSVGRLPATIEATAYFVVAEALTNVAKHARARSAAVGARIEDDTLRVDVRDDGVGGARPDGTGLAGLRDRLAVLDGRLRVRSPADGGTLVAADIPLWD
jgi:signal transduction histidine kinase